MELKKKTQMENSFRQSGKKTKISKTKGFQGTVQHVIHGYTELGPKGSPVQSIMIHKTQVIQEVIIEQ